MNAETHDRNITEQEIEVEFERLLQTYANRMDSDELIKNIAAIKHQAREHAVGRKLLLNEALRQNIEVSDTEIEMAVERMTERLGGADKFKTHLDRKNLDMAGLKERLRNARMVEKLVESITLDVPEPGDAEIKAYFAEHSEEFSQSADFEQVKGVIRLALGNAKRNEKIKEYIDKLKKNI